MKSKDPPILKPRDTFFGNKPSHLPQPVDAENFRVMGKFYRHCKLSPTAAVKSKFWSHLFVLGDLPCWGGEAQYVLSERSKTLLVSAKRLTVLVLMDINPWFLKERIRISLECNQTEQTMTTV
ncbi:hypothetical protein CEXT_315151 [Caerostris extrusa]|uniref:Uncharacterized protein n=1 Tax=Caerostris extrusa TaxID=172846 RepID=A0AAV4QHW4_CAEEX|nr:hypothetical protein CEXT_315151 [Caerostris extrusa]